MSVQSTHLKERSVAVTGNKTLAAADSGIVQLVSGTGSLAGDPVITLPVTAAAGSFIVRAGNDGVRLRVAPNSADGITGNGFTAANNKFVQIVSARAGDQIVLRGTGTTGVTGWIVESATGTWVREA
jgi:hypothetical protein